VIVNTENKLLSIDRVVTAPAASLTRNRDYFGFYDVTPLTTGTSDGQEREPRIQLSPHRERTIVTSPGVNPETDDQLAGTMERWSVVNYILWQSPTRPTGYIRPITVSLATLASLVTRIINLSIVGKIFDSDSMLSTSSFMKTINKTGPKPPPWTMPLTSQADSDRKKFAE